MKRVVRICVVIAAGLGGIAPVLCGGAMSVAAGCGSDAGTADDAANAAGAPVAGHASGAGGHGGAAGTSAGASGSQAPAAGTGGSGGIGGSAAAPAAGTGGAGGEPGAGSAGDAAPPASAASAAALADLTTYLGTPREDRDEIAAQPFAAVPLTRSDAQAAATALWDDFAAYVRATRGAEVGATESQAASLGVDGSTLRYYMAVRGDEPAGGRSLFISMHGGGNAPAATNDSQWRNQIALVTDYDPQDALWVAPRAPIDDWNMWFVPEIEPLFDRLITNLIVFEGIDPNRVYVTGYSAGGDGVYQLGPRMADRWAGAAMSAGHPNDASPLNLRNVPFAIHVGGDDSAYDRNLRAAEWGAMLEQLAAGDPGAYVNQWQVHAGLPHWMNMADAVAIPFLQMHARDPVPERVVWRQANVTQPRFYWLGVDEANRSQGTQVTAEYSEGTVALSDVAGLQRLSIRFTDAMMDLDRPVRIERAGEPLFEGQVTRTIAVIARTLEERGDPAMVFHAEVAVDLE